MKKLLLVCLLPGTLLLSHMSHAQDKWGLRRCVDYAVANNISIKQADVQARLNKLVLDQSRLQQVPTLALGASGAVIAGRQNVNAFTLTNVTYFYNSYSLQSNVNVFNFFSLRNSIDANRYAWQASLASTEKTKNDISLNVANAYLQVLLAREQAEAAQKKLELSQSQLEITRKQVQAGTLPELNSAELEAQVAQDSSNYISLVGQIQQNILGLKAYMGLDAGAPFEVDTPPVDQIPVEQLVNLQPDAVYDLALVNQPQQKADALTIEANRKNVKANRGAMYPSLSLQGSVGTNYSSNAKTVTLSNPQYLTTITLPDYHVEGTNAAVLQDVYKYDTVSKRIPYFEQLNNGFNQYVGLSLNIPIFNNGTLRTNYSRSKLNLRNAELQRDQDNLTLKNNIYQAYTAASIALQKYEANKISLAATTKSADFAHKRYAVGMLNTIDLLTNDNNKFNAEINLLSSQYDYVFKLKVLEFYKGLGIKLTKD
ncbi:MAG TPA: TolC family protein [Puia sp.]|nr:TolC family protein [Puia sp.]